MRKLLICLSIFMITAANGKIRYLSFSKGYQDKKTIFKAPEKKISNGESFIEIEYNLDDAGAYINKNFDFLRLFVEDAITFSTIKNEFEATTRIPYYKDLLVLPKNADEKSVSIEIIEEKHQDYKCPIENSEVIDNENYYVSIKDNEDKLFNNDEIAKIVSKGTFRTIPIVLLNTHPIQYDKNSASIRCYTYLKYRLVYNEKTDQASLSNLSYKLLKNESSNPDILDDYDKTTLETEAVSKPFDLLIITKDDYKAAAEKMASWKTRLGYRSKIISNPNWDKSNILFMEDSIRKYCEGQYKPDYLLIIGSSRDVPTFKAPRKDSYPTDQYWARYSSKNYDDIVKGRISVYSPEEANIVVDKIISYEKNPPTDSEFYNEALAIAYYDFANTKIGSNSPNVESKVYDFLSSAEGINCDLKSLGYNIDRHYITCKNGNPQYFLNGERMPEGMYMNGSNENTCWNNESSRINDYINEGKSFVLYRGHGNETAFSFDTYTQSDVAKLKNGNKTPIFFNFTCSTGTFDQMSVNNELCFAEALLNKKDGGAVGVFANSFKSLHHESNLIASNTFNVLFKDQDISVATAILQATFSTTEEEARNISHWFGDPTMKMYTAEPANFKPFINKGNGSTITVNSYVIGSKVTVCSIDDLGKSYFKILEQKDKNSLVFEDINVPCYITITKGNYIPYMTVSKSSLNLQNMTLKGIHNIDAENITTGSNVNKNQKEGSFTIESGETKLIASKTLSLKSGTSIKSGASLKARVGKEDSYNYKGNGQPRTTNYPLCFNNLTDRITLDDNNIYDGENYGNGLTSIANNSSESNVVIYPNPTSGYINVVANDIKEVAVMDIAGNTLIEQSVNSNNVSLDLTSFAKGMYLVKVVTAEDSYIKKVVLK